jgi:hypothetical protein
MHTNMYCAGIEPAISCVAGKYLTYYAKSTIKKLKGEMLFFYSVLDTTCHVGKGF